MNVESKTIRKGRKYDQVLQGARQVFLSDGFEGASVDEIARAADVSKATLYSYFPDKRLLFLEVARQECDQQADTALELIDTTAPPREVLLQAAQRMVDFFTSVFTQRIFRICASESDRFPELGQAFYETGPMMGRARICEYLQCAVEQGTLNIDDLPLAADQFAELCKADLFTKLIFGITTDFSPKEKARIAQGAVDMFMARYGAS